MRQQLPWVSKTGWRNKGEKPRAARVTGERQNPGKEEDKQGTSDCEYK